MVECFIILFTPSTENLISGTFGAIESIYRVLKMSFPVIIFAAITDLASTRIHFSR